MPSTKRISPSFITNATKRPGASRLNSFRLATPSLSSTSLKTWRRTLRKRQLPVSIHSVRCAIQQRTETPIDVQNFGRWYTDDLALVALIGAVAGSRPARQASRDAYACPDWSLCPCPRLDGVDINLHRRVVFGGDFAFRDLLPC